MSGCAETKPGGGPPPPWATGHGRAFLPCSRDVHVMPATDRAAGVSLAAGPSAHGCGPAWQAGQRDDSSGGGRGPEKGSLPGFRRAACGAPSSGPRTHILSAPVWGARPGRRSDPGQGGKQKQTLDSVYHFRNRPLEGALGLPTNQRTRRVFVICHCLCLWRQRVPRQPPGQGPVATLL